MFEDLAGGVAFQAAHDLGGVASLVSASRHVAAGLGVVGHAGEHDAIQRGVGLAASAAVEPVTGVFPVEAGSGATQPFQESQDVATIRMPPWWS